MKRTYSKQLVVIGNTKNIDEMIEDIKELFEGSRDSKSLIKPVSDLRSLSAQISRTLEDFPESMGLFLLRALVRAKINDVNSKILEDVNQFLILSFNKYQFSKGEIYPLLYWLILEIINIKEAAQVQPVILKSRRQVHIICLLGFELENYTIFFEEVTRNTPSIE